MMQHRFSNQGSSLVELMIGSLLGLLLITAAIQLLLTTQQIYQTQQSLARIQENARALNTILGDAVRASGTTGCNAFGSELKLKVVDLHSKYLGLEPFVGILGVSAKTIVSNHYFKRKTGKIPTADSDILWVKMVSDYAKMSHATEVFSLSDCESIYFFKELTSLKNPTINFKAAKLGVLSSVVYYVAPTKRVNAIGEPIYALFSTDLNGYSRERVEGVEQAKIFYGIQANGNERFFTHDQVPDWQAVSQVKMILKLCAIDGRIRKSFAFQWPVARLSL